MSRCTPVLIGFGFGLCHAAALADCPTIPLGSNPSPVIFCDNFNTYCSGGGHPGGAGDPADADCTSTSSPNNALLQSVWYRTSIDEFSGNLCGEEMILYSGALPSDPLPNPLGPDYPTMASFPFGGRTCTQNQGQLLLGQANLRDWQAPNPVTLTRLIQNAFGPEYTAVQGTDAHPLVISFFISSKGGPVNAAGKIWWSSGYVELAYGDESDRMNRANTDYGITPFGSCPSAANAGPFPFMCAIDPLHPSDQGLPNASRCPPGATAPVHNAIAIGALAQVDVDPCDTGLPRGGVNNHPALYNGRYWYMPRQNNPALNLPGGGSVTLLDGTVVSTDSVNPTAAPNDLDGIAKGNYKYGNFLLFGGTPPASDAKSMNWITLTIKSSTFSLHLRSREYSVATGLEYYVNSYMHNIPRAYTGPFDRIRIGVGPGCELASNASWDICKANSPKDGGNPPSSTWPGQARHCLDTNHPQGYWVDIDDLTLAGGEGYTERGACCHATGACDEDVPPDNCQAPGDQHGGANSRCSTTACCPHGDYVWADADGDGDVDSNDFGRFQRCFTGGGGPMSSDPACRCYDRDSDNDVDGPDYLKFVDCLSGSNVPWTPGAPCVQ